MENPAVTIFRNYLKINSMQPDPKYDETNAFLFGLAKDIGLECKKVEVLPGKPFVIMTWPGKNPLLKTIMLHSHVDVVPVFPEYWKVDPFSAAKMENGDIIARGSQDMKCVAIQYLEAIRRLKSEGKQCLRTIHLTFSPDEEIGSLPMAKFVKCEDFKKMNVGFALDEGIANPGSEFRVFYAERSMWWVRVSCPGQPGHGSQLIPNTAAEKIRKVMNSFLDYRSSEEQRLKENPNLSLGEVTTVNMTILEGGIQTNVVPAELTATFDIRIPPTVNLREFENQIKKWCEDAGEGVTYKFTVAYESRSVKIGLETGPIRTRFQSDLHTTTVKDCDQPITPHDKSDPWWNAFSTTLEKLGCKFTTEIFPAGTDSRYTRTCGIPALGFSPMNNTPILLHDHNEFLNEKVFLSGIDIYQQLITALADVAE